jgi:hypothetical protein
VALLTYGGISHLFILNSRTQILVGGTLSHMGFAVQSLHLADACSKHHLLNEKNVLQQQMYQDSS